MAIRHMARAIAFAALLLAAPVALAGQYEDELMAADRAFSKMSSEQGQAAAFLAFMDEDVRLFRGSGEPIVTRAKAQAFYESDEYKNSGSVKGTLTWEPLEAFASSDGTMGWTNGHWQWLGAPNEKSERAKATGHYVTIWKRQASGEWKFAGDIGNEDEKPAE